jgi:uncharacterized phage protein gp47/JayE
MTLSALGIFSAAGAGGVAGTYELIETSIVSGSSTTTVTFSNLGTYASTYKHLQIRGVAKPATNANTYLRMNGDTGNNYAWHELYTYDPASSVASSAGTSQNHIKAIYADGTGTANSFGAGVIDILDCYSSTKNKTVRILTGTTDDVFVAVRSGLWNNTASITSLTLTTSDGSNLVAGSRFSIYGIRG